MKVKQVEGALRSASPTTRERFREALSDYQSILSARIASVKEMATKEEVLRGRCGFQSKTLGHRDNPHHQPASSRRAPGAHQAPRNSASGAVASTRRSIVSVLSQSGGHWHDAHAVDSPSPSPPLSVRPQPQHDAVVKAQETPPAPSPQAIHVSHLHARPLTPPVHNHREEETTAAYSSAQREVSQLFRQQRGLQRRSTAHTEHSGAVVPESVCSTDAASHHSNATDSVRLQLSAARERNALLRKQAERVLGLVLTQDEMGEAGPAVDGVTSEASPLSSSPSYPACFCSDCNEFAQCCVERALQRTFEVLRCGLSASHDGPSDPVVEQLIAAQEESLLVRMRRVELLASRMHWQRLAYVAQAARPLLDGFSGTGLTHLDALAAAGASNGPGATSSTTALEALEVLHQLASVHGALRRHESTTLQRIADFRRSHGILSALSMLSELLWCAEETGYVE